jgi:hypothetical protein
MGNAREVWGPRELQGSMVALQRASKPNGGREAREEREDAGEEGRGGRQPAAGCEARGLEGSLRLLGEGVWGAAVEVAGGEGG